MEERNAKHNACLPKKTASILVRYRNRLIASTPQHPFSVRHRVNYAERDLHKSHQERREDLFQILMPINLISSLVKLPSQFSVLRVL